MGERAKTGAGTKGKATGRGTEQAGDERPLRPGQCRAYLGRELAREFRSIVRGFVDGAKSGSCQHVKLAMELVEAEPRAKKRRQKNPLLELVEEMERS